MKRRRGNKPKKGRLFGLSPVSLVIVTGGSLCILGSIINNIKS